MQARCQIQAAGFFLRPRFFDVSAERRERA
jgi:hypothetical protein